MRKQLTIVLIGLAVACSSAAFSQGKFSALAFGDYFYNVARDTAPPAANAALSGAKDFQGFQLRRMYFTYDDDISSQFASRFRLDADQSALTTDGRISVYLRDAYLRWKNIFQGSDLIFGMQQTPAFEISENAWGYRPVEKTIMDLRKIVSSRDLAIALRGKFDDGGTVNYWVMIGNNSGNSPETDKYKRFYANLQFKPSANVQVTVYGDLADRADKMDPYTRSTVSDKTMTAALFAGYNEPDQFSLGVEGFLQSTQNGFDDGTTLSGLSGMGISLFGSYTLSTEAALVARYDYFDPNTNSAAKGDARNFFVGGISYRPDKNVAIIPNVEVETYESLANGRSYDAAVNGRVTFSYIFQ